MSRKRIGLRKIREILRLHFECGYSDRQISRVFKMSHTTVGKIYGHVVKAGYTWPLPEGFECGARAYLLSACEDVFRQATRS